MLEQQVTECKNSAHQNSSKSYCPSLRPQISKNDHNFSFSPAAPMSFPKGRGEKVTHCLQTTEVSLIRRSTTPFYIFHLISRILLTYINDGSKYTFVKFFLQVIGVSIVFDIDSFDYLITLSHKTFEKQPSHFYCLVVKIHNTQYSNTHTRCEEDRRAPRSR